MADAASTTLPAVPAALFSKRKDGKALYAVGLLFALAMHAAAGVGASNAPVRKPPVRVEMAMVKKVKPPPPPPPPEEAKPEPPKPKEPPPKKLAKAPAPVEPPAPPPPNSTPPAEPPKKPVPILSGISLESTVNGPSNFQVAVGNTLYDDPNKNKAKPGDVQKYSAPAYRPAPAAQTGGTGMDKGVFKPVPKFQISTEPEVLREVKAPYPPDAKRDGIEGVVELRVELWQDGTVRTVKVVRPLHPSLDQAALDAMKKFTFKPATVDGQPVQYIIPRYSFRFELQG